MLQDGAQSFEQHNDDTPWFHRLPEQSRTGHVTQSQQNRVVKAAVNKHFRPLSYQSLREALSQIGISLALNPTENAYTRISEHGCVKQEVFWVVHALGHWDPSDRDRDMDRSSDSLIHHSTL